MSSVRIPLKTRPVSSLGDEVAIFGRPTLFFALALSLGVLGIYVYTLSSNYSPDSMAFAVLATRGDLAGPLFFQAEHLLWPFAGWLWYQLWLFFGYREGALAPLQVIDAMGGAAGAGFFFLSLRLLLGKSSSATLISIVSTFLLAGTYGYWYHSTEAEDQIIANALVLGSFLLLVIRFSETKYDPYSFLTLGSAKGNPRPLPIRIVKSRALLILTMGLAILFHGTAVLFLPVLLLGLWLKERSIGSLAITLVGVLALVGAAFLLVGGLVHGLRTPGGYLSWLLAAPSNGVWGKFSPRSVWTAAQTLASAIVFLRGGPNFKALLAGSFGWGNALSAFSFAAVWVLLALTVAYFVYFRRRMADSRGIALICLVWTALYGVFNVYWAPEDIQFWAGLVPPIIVALAVLHLDLVRVLIARMELLNGLFLFGFATVFIINLITAIIPKANPATNLGLGKTLCLQRASQPEDLFITPGWDWASSYGPYFTKRQVLSIVDTYLLQAGGDRSTLFQLIDDRIAGTMANGGKAYVVRLFTLDESDKAWLKRTTGLTPDDFLYERKPAWECGGEVVWEVTKR